MADQPITTSIDSLVKYLKEHGESDTSTLARVLSVSEGTVVDWADILEKAGMIKITYKVGKMFLSPDVGTGTQTAVQKSVQEVKKTTVRAEIEIQQNILKDIKEKVETYSKTVKDAEQVFKQQGGAAKPTLDKITKLESRINKLYLTISAKREAINKIVDGTARELQLLQKDTAQIRNYTIDGSGIGMLLSDVTKKVDAFNTNITALNTEFEKLVEEHRKTLRAMRTSALAEVNALKEAASKESKRIEEYQRVLEEYKRRADLADKSVGKTRANVLDEAMKAKDEAVRIYDGANAEMKEINETIRKMKESWGPLATFNDRLNEVSKELKEISKQAEDNGKVLTKIENELDKVEAKKKLSPEQREEQVEELGGQATDLREVTDALSDRSDQMKGEIDDLSK